MKGAGRLWNRLLAPRHANPDDNRNAHRHARRDAMPSSSPSKNRPLSLSASAGPPIRMRDRERLVRAVASRHRRELTGRTIARSATQPEEVLSDLLFAGPGEPRLPDEVFPKLRWGGKFVYVSPNEKRVDLLADRFDGKRGFILEKRVTPLWAPAFGLRLPGLAVRGYTFVARKTELIQPGDVTDRFTYHVRLEPDTSQPNGCTVVKRVPDKDDVIYRLKRKYPETDEQDLVKRAHKLVDHVFPVFLTREAAILKLLQRDLPEPLRCRVPRCLSTEKDELGFVRELRMNWLRVGGGPISQLDFAEQSAELLAALHEQAHIMHLDLRLDNFVITEDGVGFVDFGSAVRIGEQLEQSNMLNTLFTEMMQTSQIQRMLGKMLERGDITNQAIAEVHGKADKTVDAFYLALQIAKPKGHPELSQLIEVDRESDAYRMLANLTAAVLRPKNTDKTEFKTAGDILRGVRRIRSRLEARPRKAA